MKQRNEEQNAGDSGNVLRQRRAATAICRGFLADDLPAPGDAAKADEGNVHVSGTAVSTLTHVMSSSGGDSEGHARGRACPSSLCCSQCGETLHELSNVMTSVLTNAQMLGWKLPPYSHLKRPLRQVERNAQRGAELLRALMRKLGNEA